MTVPVREVLLISERPPKFFVIKDAMLIVFGWLMKEKKINELKAESREKKNQERQEEKEEDKSEFESISTSTR